MKLIVISIYVAPALWAMVLACTLALRVWRSEYVTLGWLNPFYVSEKYAAEQLTGKVRAQDAIYQDEMIVGRVEGEPTIDEVARTITFPTIARTDDLNPSRPFVFRSYEVSIVAPLPNAWVRRSGENLASAKMVPFYCPAGGAVFSRW